MLKEINATDPILHESGRIPLHLVVSTGDLMEPLLDVALFVVYTTIL